MVKIVSKGDASECRREGREGLVELIVEVDGGEAEGEVDGVLDSDVVAGTMPHKRIVRPPWLPMNIHKNLGTPFKPLWMLHTYLKVHVFEITTDTIIVRDLQTNMRRTASARRK